MNLIDKPLRLKPENRPHFLQNQTTSKTLKRAINFNKSIQVPNLGRFGYKT